MTIPLAEPIRHNQDQVMSNNAKFEDLKGKVLTDIENEKCGLIFTTDAGEIFVLDHEQDCCEIVTINDICGDLGDLIGEPILVAEISTSNVDDPPDGAKAKDDAYYNYTWSFYKLDTRKGGVTIRWYGETDSCYSTEVSFNRASVTDFIEH